MDINTLAQIKEISSFYNLDGEITSYRQFTNGHINSTYYVEIAPCGGPVTTGSDVSDDKSNPEARSNKSGQRLISKVDDCLPKEFIFQKINNYVFKEPRKIMDNLRELSSHLQNKRRDDDCCIIEFFQNKEGTNYLETSEGLWRICRYVNNSVTFQTVENLDILVSAGRAFGRFISLFSDFDMNKLHDTIPDFHNTKKRIFGFYKLLEEDPCGRVRECSLEIEFIKEYEDLACELVNLQEKGILPLRVTHNDTKFNNILMDKDSLEPLCVIDLDTVMPGLAAYDFGDAIRFAANNALEDEIDLSKVWIDMEKYEAFTKGFITASKEILNDDEILTLALGPIVMSLELGVRFLEDHINGDKYFRIHRKNHNLERARCQLELARDMIGKHEQMQAIINKYAFSVDEVYNK